MNAMRHIFEKDLRRLRWPLVAWLVIVISRIAAAAARSELAFADIGLQFAVENVSALLMVGDMLMLALLVSWLVHDEPLIGLDAFWLTRPIRPTMLLTAKLVFAVVFLVGAPAVGQSIAVAVITRSVGDSARVIPAFLFTQALWVAALMTIATLTPSLMRFLLTLAGGVAALALVLSVMTTVLVMMAEDVDSYRDSMLEDATTSIVGSWLVLGVALAVIVSQYRTRRFRRSLLLGVVGILVSMLLADLWPWRFAKPAEPDPGAWAHDSATVAAVLDADAEPYVTDAFQMRRLARAKKQIAVPIHLTGVPSTYSSESMSVRGRLEFPSGPALESAQGTTVPVRRDGLERPYDSTAPLRAALGSARLLSTSGDPPYGHWPVVLTVTDDEYQRYGRTLGRLTANLNVFLQESRVVGSVPLVEGATLRNGSLRLELRRVVRRPDGCTVLIRQVTIGSLARSSVPRSYRFVLRNAQRGEAVLGDSAQLAGGGLQFRGVFIPAGGSSGLAFDDRIENYPPRSPFSAALQIDAAWLDGADLAVIETAYAGRVTRSLAVEEFRMRR